MDKLVIPTPSNGIPFNWDDLEMILGQSAYDAGIYNLLTAFFSSFGDDFIISGCQGSGGVVTPGWVFVGGEILKVDEQSFPPTFLTFQKQTTTVQPKQTQLSGIENVYERNRGVLGGSTGVAPNGESLLTKLKGLIPATTLARGTAEQATNTEVINGVDDERFITSAGLTAKDGGVRRYVIEIDAWNMNYSSGGDLAKSVSIGSITPSDVVSINGVIRGDTSANTVRVLSGYNVDASQNYNIIHGIIGGSIRLTSATPFDNTEYDSTAFNRGYLILDVLV